MTEILTDRLRITPMTQEELSSLINLFKNTNPELSDAYSEMLDNCKKHPSDYLWYTSWKICLQNDMKEIGYAGFKGIKNGYTEIGYGINEEFQGKGFATEAVKALCRWAFENPNIEAVEAETEKDNLASEKVLLKTGFCKTGKFGEEGPRSILRRNNQIISNG